MSIKCILFDADGVVIQSEMFSVKYEEEYKMPASQMLPFFQGEFNNCLIGKADLKEVIQPWLTKWRWEGTAEEFLEYWFKAEDHIDHRMIDIITQLRTQGIICCLATNQEQYRTEYMMQEMGFSKFFDYIFSSVNIGFHKPQAEFFHHILQKISQDHNIHAEEILFIDDTKQHTEAAKSLGIKTHHYTSFIECRDYILSKIKLKNKKPHSSAS